MGFEVPTAVQAHSIPVILSGRDILISAATGTGKTIAYLAPIIHHLQACVPRVRRSDGTVALVIVPTRELALQIYETLQKLLHRFHWIVPGYLVGGENRSKEKARLRKGISILAATPGRLLDHLRHTQSFIYMRLQWVVFDEADRILGLGFEKHVHDILEILGSVSNDLVSKDRLFDFRRQNLLLSATLNANVHNLANISLENPAVISLDSREAIPDSDFHHCGQSQKSNWTGMLMNSSVDIYNFPAQLIQRYVKVPCGSRLAVLLSILRSFFEKGDTPKIVVFFSTCLAVDFHFSFLREFCWSVDLYTEANEDMHFVSCKIFHLHGNMDHESRRKSFQEFKEEKSALLLSTDVAARGLDFPKVTCIIQYDSPGEACEYVHRVGRTARAGENGEALLFLQQSEMEYLKELQKHQVSLCEFPLFQILKSYRTDVQKHSSKKLLSLEMHPWLLSLQKAIESFISKEGEMRRLAMDAFWSWVCAYATHRDKLKRIFMVKKLHLGHVARSFGLKDLPSSVGRSYQNLTRKRKRESKQWRGQFKR